MSTEENSSLAASEQQTEPTIDAGCEIEVNRSVSWTAHSAGFAELRRRAVVGRATAEFQIWVFGVTKRFKNSAKLAKRDKQLFDQFIDWIDDVSACEGCKHVGETISTSMGRPANATNHPAAAR